MKKAIFILFGSLGLVGFTLFSIVRAQADWTPSDYQMLIQSAEKYVEKQRAKQELHQMAIHGQNTNVLSLAAMNLGLSTSPSAPTYKTGQEWNVVAYQELPLAASENTLQNGRSAAFHFQVISSDPSTGLRIRVRPITAYGLSNVDSKVQYADFIYSNDLKLTAKYYKLRGYRDPIPLSPDNFKVGVSVMEGYPLELPQITDAEKDDSCNMQPALPSTFKKAIDQAGYAAFTTTDTCWMNADFFGRSIQSIWPETQPFPTYLKTTQGYAVLARQEVR
jgi:hypothetical protein